jgi:hypothetical protein
MLKEEGRRKREEGRRKKEEGRGKKEEGRRKREVYILCGLGLQLKTDDLLLVGVLKN